MSQITSVPPNNINPVNTSSVSIPININRSIDDPRIDDTVTFSSSPLHVPLSDNSTSVLFPLDASAVAPFSQSHSYSSFTHSLQLLQADDLRKQFKQQQKHTVVTFNTNPTTSSQQQQQQSHTTQTHSNQHTDPVTISSIRSPLTQRLQSHSSSSHTGTNHSTLLDELHTTLLSPVKTSDTKKDHFMKSVSPSTLSVPLSSSLSSTAAPTSTAIQEHYSRSLSSLPSIQQLLLSEQRLRAQLNETEIQNRVLNRQLKEKEQLIAQERTEHAKKLSSTEHQILVKHILKVTFQLMRT